MNKTTTKLLACGVLVVLGIVTWRVLQKNPLPEKSTQSSLVDTINPTKDAKNIQTPLANAITDTASSNKTERPKVYSPSGTIFTHGKSLDEVYVQYWAESYGFEISDNELARAQEAYISASKARQRLEDTLAQVERIDSSHYKITIPAYPEEGLMLKQEFESSLASILGNDRANQFLSKIAVPLDRANFGWGLADQTLDVSLRTDNGIETLEIAHGFAMPDSGNFSNIAGVSNSALSPNKLGAYTYLKKHFPGQSPK